MHLFFIYVHAPLRFLDAIIYALCCKTRPFCSAAISINIDNDPEVMAAEDVRVLGEIRTEVADSALVPSNERDQESCSDT